MNTVFILYGYRNSIINNIIYYICIVSIEKSYIYTVNQVIFDRVFYSQMAGKELGRENYISRLTLIIIQIKSATVNIRMTFKRFSRISRKFIACELYFGLQETY